MLSRHPVEFPNPLGAPWGFKARTTGPGGAETLSALVPEKKE
jgi:hypothetical protein